MRPETRRPSSPPPQAGCQGRVIRAGLLAILSLGLGLVDRVGMAAGLGQGHGGVRITVDTAAPRVAVNPRMYGIFFEEINHAGDGGLYAELIRNRDFEAREARPARAIAATRW